jgi:hypothetical protein
VVSLHSNHYDRGLVLINVLCIPAPEDNPPIKGGYGTKPLHQRLLLLETLVE